jgi:hypothetical protein
MYRYAMTSNQIPTRAPGNGERKKAGNGDAIVGGYRS